MWGWVKKAARAVKKVAVGAAHAVRGVASFAVQFVKGVVHRIIGIPEFFGTLFGYMPEKQIAIEPLILMKDGTPLATLADVQTVLDLAADTFHEQVNVRVVNGQGRRPLILAAEVPPDNLSVTCADSKVFFSNFSDVGAWFRSNQAEKMSGTIFGYGQPVTVFVVENVEGNNSGCCTGFISDYAVIDPGALDATEGDGRLLTLAHEVGHACGLPHPFVRGLSALVTPGRSFKRDIGNLMKHASDERGRRLGRLQRAVFRSSGHVTKIQSGTITDVG